MPIEETIEQSKEDLEKRKQERDEQKETMKEEMHRQAIENEMARQEPLVESQMDRPVLEPKKDFSIGEAIAENTLARAYPELNVNHLDSDHQLQDTDWKGPRSDFFLTDANEKMVGVAEAKTYTGEISDGSLNEAYKQLVNSAERFDVENAALVTVNERGEANLFEFTLTQLKEMDQKVFRDFIKSKL